VGDVVWSQFTVPVPENAPAGLYKLHAVFYDSASGERLLVEQGMPGLPAIVLPDVRVQSSEPPPLPAHAAGIQLGSSIVLDGFDDPLIADPNSLVVNLYWRGEGPIAEDYVAFVQLLDAEGRLVAQSDSWPAQGALPTSAWLADELIVDEHRLALPKGMPEGRYRLIAGLYLLETGERLTTRGGEDFVELDGLPPRLP
jgi:hypothetical protein